MENKNVQQVLDKVKTVKIADLFAKFGSFRTRAKDFLIEDFSQAIKKKSKRFLVVDFSQDMTEVVYLESKSNGGRLLSYDFEQVSKRSERKDNTPVQLIKNFLTQHNIHVNDVVVSLSDSAAVFIKYLTLPVIPPDEIVGAAKYQLKEDFTFDLETASIDWQIIREFTDEDGVKKNGIIFIVVKKEVIDKHIGMVKQVGLHPIGVVSGSFNYANILKHFPEKIPAAAVLEIDYKASTFAIYTDNKLNFIRRLPISWERITQSLTEILVSDRGKIELSFEQAEEIKNTYGIPQDESLVINDNIQATHLISLMRPLLEALVRELRFSFNYASSNFDMDRPPVLYITGGGANLKNLDTYLSKELGMDVRYLPLPPSVETKDVAGHALTPQDLNRIINPIGAALGDPTSINLLPLEIKTQKVERFQKISLRLIGIVVGLIFLFLWFVSGFQVRDYNTRLKNAQVHLSAIRQIEVLKQRISSRENFLLKIQEGKIPVDGLLKLLSSVTPPEIVLNDMNFDQGNHGLVIRGILSATEDTAEPTLTNYMERLETSEFFEDAVLVSSQRLGMLQDFEIRCEIAAQ